MRLFIAVKISDSLTGVIRNWQKSMAKLHPEPGWTKQNQLHLTLRFLGNREPGGVISAMNTLNLHELLPLEYTLSRSGSFGNPSSIFWLSGSFSPAIFSIVHRLASIPDQQGKPGDERSFSPHITIARVPRGSVCSVPVFNEQVKEVSNSIHLMNSRLTPEGPVYSTLFTVSG